MKTQGVAKRFVSGSLYVFIALIISGIIGISIRIFLAHNLSVDDFGLFFWVLSFVMFFSIFRDLGFNTALTKFIPEFILRKKTELIKSSILFVALVQTLLASLISLSLFVFSDQLVAMTIGVPHASILIKILSMWFFFLTYFHIFRSVARGFQDIKTFTGMEILYIGGIATAILLMYPTQLTVEKVGLAYLLGTFVPIIFYTVSFWIKHSATFKIWSHVSDAPMRELTLFALPLFFGGIGGFILGYFGTILLGTLRNLAEVAFYQTASLLIYGISYFFSAIVIVFLPLTSELWTRKKKTYLGKVIYFVMKFSLISVMPFVLIFLLFPDITMISVYTTEYLPGATTLQILSLTVFITGPLVILEKCVAPGIGKTLIVTKINVVASVIHIVFNLVLIPWYGASGAALALLSSSFVRLVLAIFLVREEVRFSFPTWTILKAGVVGGLMICLAWGLKSLIVLPHWWAETFLVVAPCLLFYFSLTLLLKIITREDLFLLTRVFPLPQRIVKIARALAGY